VKLVRGFSAFGFVKLLRVCNLYHFVMESVDTVHVLSNDDNACAHGDTAGVGDVNLSCGGTETSQYTEVTGLTVQRFVETNTHIGEQVATKEEAVWQVILEKLSANQKLRVWAVLQGCQGLRRCSSPRAPEGQETEVASSIVNHGVLLFH
jgi:hypothetical protein